MITTGIITAINISSDSEHQNNLYEVDVSILRMPGNENNAKVRCTACVPAGFYNSYKVGDTVYLGFLHNQAGQPVILGKIYKGLIDEAASYGNLESLSVKSNVKLPEDTKIGELTYKDLLEIKTKAEQLNIVMPGITDNSATELKYLTIGDKNYKLAGSGSSSGSGLTVTATKPTLFFKCDAYGNFSSDQNQSTSFNVLEASSSIPYNISGAYLPSTATYSCTISTDKQSLIVKTLGNIASEDPTLTAYIQTETVENNKNKITTIPIGIPIVTTQSGANAFNIELLSTKGNTFHSSTVDTEIYVKVSEGVKDITGNLSTDSFVWAKYDIEGKKEETWTPNYSDPDKHDRIKVNASDVYSKAIFECSIII